MGRFCTVGYTSHNPRLPRVSVDLASEGLEGSPGSYTLPAWGHLGDLGHATCHLGASFLCLYLLRGLSYFH